MNRHIEIPRHGGQLHQIAARFNIPASELLDFSANINPEGPPPSVMAALREALNDPRSLNQYPDLEETELRLAISAYANVAPETVAVANGFVPLLDATLRALPLRRCLLPVPAFGEYRVALARAGVAITPYLLNQETEFRYQPEALLAALAAGQNDSILLANPQNPSGVSFSRAELTDFIHAATARNIYVLLDEAFIDYIPVESMVTEVERNKKLIIFRSVTKFHGIPGLRVAYAVAANDLRQQILAQLPPWSITRLAAIGVQAALSDSAFAADTLTLNLQRKADLATQLDALNLYTYPAAANYLLIRFDDHHPGTASYWERLITLHGIVLRSCDNFEGLSPNHLRCAVLGSNRNARLIQAFASIRGHL